MLKNRQIAPCSASYVASATKGQGVVAHDILREVKGWSPPKSGADSASSRSLASADYSGGEPPSGPAVVKPRTGSPGPSVNGPGGASSKEEKAPTIVEVIRGGSQTTYITLVEGGGEVTKP